MSLEVPYKIFPLKQPWVALPSIRETWVPVLNVSIIVAHTTSKRFEAIVDSGSPVCLFHADIGKQMGLKPEDGKADELGGVVGGSKGTAYFHKIKLKVMADIIPITAGFSPQLSVAAILGRHGFFENFIVTFDPCSKPPGLRVERVHRV